MKSIILIGYMGSGKTTVGRQLALALGRTFYDLDWYIEMRYHRTVAQLFAERGEDGFREMERNMLHESVYLKATPEVLARHLKMRKVERPLLQGKSEEELLEYIRTSLAEREKFYLQAEHIIDVSLLDNYDKLQISVQLIRKELGL